jgi:hypothetical protein
MFKKTISRLLIGMAFIAIVMTSNFLWKEYWAWKADVAATEQIFAYEKEQNTVWKEGAPPEGIATTGHMSQCSQWREYIDPKTSKRWGQCVNPREFYTTEELHVAYEKWIKENCVTAIYEETLKSGQGVCTMKPVPTPWPVIVLKVLAWVVGIILLFSLGCALWLLIVFNESAGGMRHGR